MRINRRKFANRSARKRLHQSRLRRFESLEARQMLNAAPVANDDTYIVAEDGVLNAGGTLPASVNPIRWAENGHYYAHIPATIASWRGAETAAANMRYQGSQGHLLSITSAGEEAFVLTSVVGHLPQESRVYFGATDRDVEGQWKWVTGEPVSYSNWRPGEPTPGNNDEDYGAMYYFPQGWLWGDIPDNGNFTGSYIVEFDGPFANSPLANDTDADNNPLTAVLVDEPDHGKLDLIANGSFTYTPDADFSGVDSFTYKANDGQANSNLAKVTINVTPNAAPVANNDTYTVPEDTVLRAGHSNLPAGVVAQRWSQNGHYYAFVPGGISWTGAEAAASKLQYLGSAGHLVTITSQAEQDFLATSALASLRNSQFNIWIGLNDAAVEGEYRWVTGEPFSYSAWQQGEPNNSGDEDYIHLVEGNGAFRWNDRRDVGHHGYIVEFDGPISDSIVANDTDAERDALAAAIVAGPQHGTLSLDATGLFAYTPDRDFVGADTFTYKVNDGDSDSNVATVTINVTPVNDAPAANPERYVTGQNLPLTVAAAQGVLANDTDVEGDSFSAALVTGPSKGQLTLNPNGSFTYTPSTGYFGPDSFTYQASDGKQTSEAATVSLFVTNPNNVAPVAKNDQFTTGEDRALVVTGNLPGGVEAKKWNGNGHHYALVTSPLAPPEAIAAAQALNYLGSAGHLVTITSAAERAFLELTFGAGLANSSALIGLSDTAQEGNWRWVTGEATTFTSWNGGEPNGGTNENYVEMFANGTWNDVPVWLTRPYLVEFDGPFMGGVLGNDSDANGDALSAVLVTPPQHGAVVFNGAGTFVYTPNQNYNGQDSFTYKVNDGQFDSNVATVSITITPNRAPVAQNDSYTTAEDIALVGQPTLPGGIAVQRWSGNGHYYAHVPGGTHWLDAEAAAAKMTYLGATGHLVTLTSAAEEAFLTSGLLANWVTNPVFIGLTDRAAEGDFRWITGEPLTYTNWVAGEPNDFGSGQDYANLARFTDGKWQWDDVWDSPHFGSYIVEFDGPFAGGVLANDSDADKDQLTAVLASPPAHGTVALNSDGTFVYTPNVNYNGPDSFTYTAKDGDVSSNIATVNITVQAVNDAPTVVPDTYTVVEEGKLSRNAAQGVLANDSDPEGNAFTAALADGPKHGQVTFNPDGSFTYTPGANFSGTDTFTYRAIDAISSQPATVTIQVTPVNDAPVAMNEAVTLTEDTSLTFISAAPQGFTPVQWSANGHYYALVRNGINWPNAKNAAVGLRFQGSRGHLVSVTSNAEHQFLVESVLTGFAQRYWIGLTDEESEGNFRWTTGEPVSFTNWGGAGPDNANGNEHYVEVVHDAGTPFWRWNDINATFGGNGYVVEFEGPFNKGVLENDVDVDNDALTASLVSGPSNGALQLNADGTFTYTPNPNFSGADSFSYKARDGQAESNVATVTLNVVPGNDAPVAAADSYFIADKLTVNAASGVLANDSDVDTPKANLTAQLVTPPAAGTLSLNPDGSFVYTRGLNFSGSDTFTYRTSDGSALSAPVTVTIAAALRLRTENVTIVSQPLAPVEGFFDVYVDVAPGFDFLSAGYDVALRTAAGSGITLVSAAAPSAAHPSLFASQPTFIVSAGTLRVTDALATGSADVDNGDGLFRVRFTVATETVGAVPLLFTTAFTNLADENGNPLPIDRAGGTITVTEPPAPRVTGVLVRSSEWSSQFVNSIHAQGLGSAISAGEGQLADVPWVNVDQIVVRFNEHVSVQQADLAVRGVNSATYVISGFAYNPATFTATWTLDDPLPADKVRIQLAAGGADPIRNATGVRLDGDWSDSTSAYPSGNGRSGGDFQFRFDVLPGNTDQTGPVNIFDTIKTRNRQFTTVGDANYNPLYDVNGSGDINIFDTIQVRNHQFTSLPEGEPTVAPTPPEPAIAPAPFPVRIRTENVTVTSNSSTAVEGVFDVFVDVMAGVSISVAGYDVALRTPPGSGVTLVSAGMPSAAHAGLFASEPTDFVSQNMLGVTDSLPSGAAPLDHNDGLFSVRFSVSPGTVGSVPLSFNTNFTNLADAQGNPVPLDTEAGVITITSPPITITGTSGNDTYHVLRSGSQLRIYENTAPVGNPTYTVDLATMPSAVVINAGDGNDSLTVDPGAQTALGINQLIYTAGTGANTLALASGSARIDSTATGGTLNTTVAGGAQLSTAVLKQNELALASNSRVMLLPSGGTSVITGLALGAGATLDIGTGALVLDYTGASPVATIRQHILAGRGGSGLGASWNGTGITSSAVAQANQTEPESRSVGFAENALLPLGAYTTFRGVSVDNTAVLIAYARTSDANLDGVVNDDDVTVVGATYAPAVANANWASGDFDFDGFVDDDDVTLLGVFYSPVAALLPSPLSGVSGGVVSGAWSDVDHELIDLLAESIAIEEQAQSASLADPHRSAPRRSQVADNVWSHWQLRTSAKNLHTLQLCEVL